MDRVSNGIVSVAIRQLKKDPSCVLHENAVREKWMIQELYLQLVELEKKYSDIFKFIDGPPFVSGTLHMGHLTIMSLKNVIQNFMRMHKKQVENKLGYDCHGLPIESIIMTNLNLKTSIEIRELGISTFNNECKKAIKSFSGSWKPLYDITARFNNPNNSYMTLDKNFMESVWWVFKQIFDKGMCYKGFKVMPYSYGLQTQLSNFEAKQKYLDIETQTVYACFPIKNTLNRYIVAWTTTPWTLFSNIALCVNSVFEYYLCSKDGKEYIVAKQCIKNLPKFDSTTFFAFGKDLIGLQYEPLYNFIDFKQCSPESLLYHHTVVADSYVITDKDDISTGVVHLSPAHGEDDNRICLTNKISTIADLQILCLVNELGNFDNRCGIYSNKLVFDVSQDIIKDLKIRKLCIKTQLFKHSYPHCYRTDTPLIQMPTSSFFIGVSAIKTELMKNNDKITYQPSHIKNKMNDWLSGVKDWSVSRSRFFGTGIPIWESDDGLESICIGSIDELVKLANLDCRPDDLHREFIDDIVIVSEKSGKLLKRTPFVFDCWFESGCVPYAQEHYPFENKDKIDNCEEFLTDLIAEGLDQTRGWFYTLLVISTIISNKPPAKHISCIGIVLDKTGLKLSKKYGNYVDPTELLETHGVDVLRLYLLGSKLVDAEPLYFNIDDLKIIKQRIIPLYNSIWFFLEHYSNLVLRYPELQQFITVIDNKQQNLTLMDKWILEKIYYLRLFVEDKMKLFEINKVISELLNFIDEFANWYLKFNRDRLKGLESPEQWTTSLSVMLTVVMDFIHIATPFTPIMTEYLYSFLIQVRPELFIESSIHMRQYPVSIFNFDIMQLFNQIQTITKLIRNYRDTSKIHSKLKIPIRKCIIKHPNNKLLEQIEEHITIIQEEVNCLEFCFGNNKQDQQQEYIYVPKFDNKLLGQKFKKEASHFKEYISLLSQEELLLLYDFHQLNTIEEKNITFKNFSFEYTNGDFSVQKISKLDIDPNIKCMNENELTLIIDTINDENTNNLFLARSFANTVQKARKQMGLRVLNNIQIICPTNIPQIWKDLFVSHSQYFETKLKTNIKYNDAKYSNTFDMTINDEKEFVFSIELI